MSQREIEFDDIIETLEEEGSVTYRFRNPRNITDQIYKFGEIVMEGIADRIYKDIEKEPTEDISYVLEVPRKGFGDVKSVLKSYQNPITKASHRWGSILASLGGIAALAHVWSWLPHDFFILESAEHLKTAGIALGEVIGAIYAGGFLGRLLGSTFKSPTKGGLVEEHVSETLRYLHLRRL